MSTLSSAIENAINKTPDIPVRAATIFLLSLAGETIGSVTERARVTRQAANRDIAGGKPCKRFRDEVVRSIGFVPWEEKA